MDRYIGLDAHASSGTVAVIGQRRLAATAACGDRDGDRVPDGRMVPASARRTNRLECRVANDHQAAWTTPELVVRGIAKTSA